MMGQSLGLTHSLGQKHMSSNSWRSTDTRRLCAWEALPQVGTTDSYQTQNKDACPISSARGPSWDQQDPCWMTDSSKQQKAALGIQEQAIQDRPQLQHHKADTRHRSNTNSLANPPAGSPHHWEEQGPNDSQHCLPSGQPVPRSTKHC